MTAPSSLQLRGEVRELLGVCRSLLTDSAVWSAIRDAAPGAMPPSSDLLRHLAGVGVIAARQVEPADGGLTVVEAAAVMETLGSALTPVSIAGAMAAGPALSEYDACLAQQVADGEIELAVAVQYPVLHEVRVPTSNSAPVLLLDTPTKAVRSDLREIGHYQVDPTRPVTVYRYDSPLPVDPEAVLALQKIGASHEVLLAAEAVGAARRACALTTDYVKDRCQFNRPIGSFQAVKHALADVWCDIEVAAAAVGLAANRIDSGDAWDLVRPDAAVAVQCAVNALQHAAESAVHLHGGMGVAWESGLHAFVRRSLAIRVLLDAEHRNEHTVLLALKESA